ncbi:sn-glycerol-3-phosphate ABC transporter permease UgpE [Allorhizobium taibaishanense]|uniref:sn-glycerol-3-phosphate transport system permease protein UgpE n=1 Tax=Allorhizobium taibaishanense TaxID=887144 RepID=A0A1Q9A8M9_9HYPH|nr:sn-glycerol-3-phosphate ABC transporter permease UgpE [Allorhizobium taibaishanense]MBB4009549.1 sn-glycerol 3-phosphate transport system permease protein [Allorhizobium taibaishanense]OLP50921.1 glycerol-3-phosphate ABC transporter permease [Allorhizobium taibaishanense]
MYKTKFFDHVILIAGCLLMLAPIIVAFTTSTHSAPEIHQKGLMLSLGDNFGETYHKVLFAQTGFNGTVTGLSMMLNSLILGLGFACGKIVLSMLAAYAIVYFRFRFATLAFWMIFTTLLLPLEVRIMPSYQVMSELHLLNTYTGLILPLLASATGTFFFRQFFKSVPEELLEAARIDGAGPVKFFIDILLPLSRSMIAAVFIIMFVYGWNQYLWPILMTTDESFFTLMRGIKQILQVWVGAQIPDYNEAFAMAVLAMLPPVLIVVVFQSWFIKGLTETDK